MILRCARRFCRKISPRLTGLALSCGISNTPQKRINKKIPPCRRAAPEAEVKIMAPAPLAMTHKQKTGPNWTREKQYHAWEKTFDEGRGFKKEIPEAWIAADAENENEAGLSS